jgi:hypothetical protein
VGAARLNDSSSDEISERRLLMICGRYILDNYRWVVGFALDIQWCIIGFGVGHVLSIGQVKTYIEKVQKKRKKKGKSKSVPTPVSSLAPSYFTKSP